LPTPPHRLKLVHARNVTLRRLVSSGHKTSCATSGDIIRYLLLRGYTYTPLGLPQVLCSGVLDARPRSLRVSGIPPEGGIRMVFEAKKIEETPASENHTQTTQVRGYGTTTTVVG
jgi:hypothetical protein